MRGTQVAEAPAAQLLEQPQCRQRVATEFEEGIVRADVIQREHVGEDRAHRRFACVAGHACDGQVGRARLRRTGQRGAVELAVRGERQRRQRDERGGHHVVRQDARQRLAQRGRRDALAHDVGQ